MDWRTHGALAAQIQLKVASAELKRASEGLFTSFPLPGAVQPIPGRPAASVPPTGAGRALESPLARRLLTPRNGALAALALGGAALLHRGTQDPTYTVTPSAGVPLLRP